MMGYPHHLFLFFENRQLTDKIKHKSRHVFSINNKGGCMYEVYIEI